MICSQIARLFDAEVSLLFKQMSFLRRVLCAIAKLLACVLKVSEFSLQSHYSIHFQTDTLLKRMNPFIIPAIG